MYTDTDETLLLKRVMPSQFWQSVTGSMKWDETVPVKSALRELREETGIHVQQSDIRDWNQTFEFEILPNFRHRYPPDATFNTEHMLSVKLPEPYAVTLSPTEHEEYKWQSIDLAIETVWSWTNRRALQMIRQEGR